METAVDRTAIVRSTVRNIVLIAQSGSYVFCSKNGSDNWEIEDVSPASDRVGPDVLGAVNSALNIQSANGGDKGKEVEKNKDVVGGENEDVVGDLTGVDDEDEDGEIGNEDMDTVVDYELEEDEEQLMATVRGATDLIHERRLLQDANSDSADAYIQALENLVLEQPVNPNDLDSSDRLMWEPRQDQEEGDSTPGRVDEVDQCDNTRSLSPSISDHQDVPSSSQSFHPFNISPPTPPFYVSVPVLSNEAKALYRQLLPQTPPQRHLRLDGNLPSTNDQISVESDDEAGSLYQPLDEEEDAAGLLSSTGLVLPPQSPRKRKSCPTANSKPSSLITTPLLASADLVYHVQYQLLICNSCQIGVCLDQSYAHVTGKSDFGIKEWDSNKHAYVNVKGRHHHQFGPKMHKPRFVADVRSQLAVALKKLKEEIDSNPNPGSDTNEGDEDEDDGPTVTILTSYHTAHDRDRSKEWLDSVKPHLDQEGPVEGLKVFRRGYKCTAPPCSDSHFPFCALSEQAMQRHHGRVNDRGKLQSGTYILHDVARKRGEKLWEEGPVQTFFQAGGMAAYFPVIYATGLPLELTPATLPTSSPSEADFSPEALANLIDQVESRYATTMLGENHGRSELFDPVFAKMSMTVVWENVSKAEARRITSIHPVRWESASEPTRRLFAAVSGTFLGACNIAKIAGLGVLNLIGKGSALYTNHTIGRPFSIPLKQTTLNAYLLWELQYLRRMLYARRNPIKREDGKDAFRFDNHQQDALCALDTALRSKTVSLTEVGHLVGDALHSLYFPPSPDRAAFDVFEDPLFVYLALICRTPEGIPVSLADIPPMLSKAQFSVRLKALRHLHHDFQQNPSLAVAPPMTTVVPSGSRALSDEESLLTPQPSPVHRAAPGSRALSDEESLFTPQPSPVHRAAGSRALSDEESLFTPQPSPVHRAASQPHPSPSPSGPKLRLRRAQVSDTITTSDSDAEMDESALFDQESNYSKSDGADASDRMDVDKPEGASTVAAERKESAEFTEWFANVAVRWCDKNLTPGNLSPYSTLRDLMHVSSHQQRNSRKLPNMQWLSDNLLLVEKKHQFIPSQFFDFVEYQLKRLEVTIRDDVLCGFTLDDLGIPCNFSKIDETGDVKTNFYCPLLPKDELQNEDSKRFMVKLLQQRTLVSPAAGKQMEWNSEVAWLWTGAIREATVSLYALAHILQGSPGRGTEEHLMQIANTTSRRHLFVENAMGTLAIFSNYWKGSSAQGRFKEILRVFPYRISRLLFILIRVVRPVERLFTMKFEAREVQEEITTTYRTMLWASAGHQIDGRTLSQGICRFFKHPDCNGKETFKWISGVRLYRHLAAAIQRRRIPGTARYTPAIEKEGIQIGDLQAGRSGGISEQHYAVLETFIPADSNLISHYQAYSMCWHQLFGQSTSFEEGRVYIV